MVPLSTADVQIGGHGLMRFLAVGCAIALLIVSLPLLMTAMRVLWRRPAWALVLTTALVAVPYQTGAEQGGGRTSPRPTWAP